MNAARPELPEPLRSFQSVSAALQAQIIQVDALLGEFRRAVDAGAVSPNTIEAMRIALTYHSNAIEGSTLTLRETQLVIEGRTPSRERPLRELYEARNHDRAIRLIESRIKIRSTDAAITERDMLDVHADVLADIDDTHAGRYRDGRVLIAGTGYVPPGPHRFEALMPALYVMANTPDLHPLLRAAEFHYNLVAVHPFVDGNGRTARLMANELLLRHGYPHLIIDIARRGDYLTALDDANAGRLHPFARFIVESCIASLLKATGESD